MEIISVKLKEIEAIVKKMREDHDSGRDAMGDRLVVSMAYGRLFFSQQCEYSECRYSNKYEVPSC